MPKPDNVRDQRKDYLWVDFPTERTTHAVLHHGGGGVFVDYYFNATTIVSGQRVMVDFEESPHWAGVVGKTGGWVLPVVQCLVEAFAPPTFRLTHAGQQVLADENKTADQDDSPDLPFTEL